MLKEGGFRLRSLAIGFLLLLGAGVSRSTALAIDEQMLIVPQPGTPIGIKNFVQPELACQYAGIGGQVFDQIGQPQIGLIVNIFGTISDQPVDLFAVTGSSEKFGPGGYLIQLGEAPFESNEDLTLKLVNIAGEQLSANIQVNTFDECSKNLLLVNLIEIQFANQLYLPVIRR